MSKGETLECLRRARRVVTAVGVAALLAGCHGNRQLDEEAAEPADPPEVTLGERLFLETRFAQSFAARFGEDVNVAFGASDPVVDVTVTTGEPLPGPFGGQSMNCRSCHLVDEQGGLAGGGVRTYADFARRSPIPARSDGKSFTPRNSPALVNASLRRDSEFFLHFDGEFGSVRDLVRGTYTGRNFGWLAGEQDAAVAQIARVIRGDDGRGALAGDFGGFPYRDLFAGVAAEIPPDLRIPESFRIDVLSASDSEVVDAVDALVAAYVESLVFTQDESAEFAASPYDVFLRRNGLPRSPAAGESPIEYSRRLLRAVDALANPRFVDDADGSFSLHEQAFVFGAQELRGMQVFFEENPAAARSVGNCVACHTAPVFTDFSFHNTAASQDEYDSIHGDGAFASLVVPGLAERNAHPQEFLPPSAAYPNAVGPFLDIPGPNHTHTDLGVWNVFANPAIPAPQAALQELLCRELVTSPCTPERLLPFTIGLFKTPGLRSLGQSAPYLHTGQKDTIEAVIDFYIRNAFLARHGQLRNAAPELVQITVTAQDAAALAAFLRALNEDYS